jgi:hypothetical protein
MNQITKTCFFALTFLMLTFASAKHAAKLNLRRQEVTSTLPSSTAITQRLRVLLQDVDAKIEASKWGVQEKIKPGFRMTSREMISIPVEAPDTPRSPSLCKEMAEKDRTACQRYIVQDWLPRPIHLAQR